MTHELKILPQYYKEIISQRKTFEIRKDDRNFQVGDRLFLREWDGEKYTGRLTRNREITYILRDAEKYGLKEGYCILGIQPVGWDWIKQTTVIQNGNNNMTIGHVDNLTL